MIAIEVGCREIKNNGWCSSWIVSLNGKNSQTPAEIKTEIKVGFEVD
jgi:hypothetical protein